MQQKGKVQSFLEGISATGEVIMEALARVVEYLATFATIYLILEVGITALQSYTVAHNIALGIILSSPELVMIGAYGMATRELEQGNKAGWALLVSVGVLLLLTFLTVFDLMVWHFDESGVNMLMAFRFVASIMYAFTRGVVTRKSEHQQPVAEQLIIDVQAMVNVCVLVAQDALQEQKVLDQARKFDELTVRITQLQQQQIAPPVTTPSINVEALTDAIITRVEAINEARFEALREAKVRQKVVVSEASAPPQIEAPKPRREAKNEAGGEAKKMPQNILPMRQPNTTASEKRASVYRLADNGEGLSSYEIADQTGIPVSTVQRYLKERRAAPNEATDEAEDSVV